MNEADRQMALLLQKQFDMEISTEKPTNNLAYYDKKKKKELSPSKSKSLIDPSWELVDPTPNIHVLFMAFNERFFWNKLLAVTVSWSKRMTTCAGVCSYEGRSGECKITVSEPLLKLRPRKDLVETLLHEMIHALLFVTRNNRDRDGHGPEFHKHMYRINNEAGTKITVYHDFHDEVKLYQQHWWRCDGPCQKRRPFFGMVRRAMNRAPGPNDRWWYDHKRSCGGKFIKVKEPEKVTKAKEKKEPKVKEIKNAGDIRKFISGTNGNKSNANKNKSGSNINSFNDTNKNKTSNNSTPTNNINTISSIKGAGAYGTKNKNGTVVLNPTNKPAKPDKNKENVPVRPKNNIVTIKDLNAETNNNLVVPVKPYSSSAGSPITDYSVVRNKWLDKFDNKNKKSSEIKRKSSGDSNSSDPKKVKTDNSTKAVKNRTSPNDKSEGSKKVNGFWKSPNKDDHLVMPENDNKVNGFWRSPTGIKTENNSSSDNKINGIWKSPIKNDSSPKKVNGFWKSPVKIKTEIDSSPNTMKNVKIKTESTVINNSLITESKTESSDKVNCPVCDKLVSNSKLNKHLDHCLQNDNSITSELKDEMSTPSDLKLVQCPSCNKFIDAKDLNDHLDVCLNEPKPSTSKPKPITSNLAQCEICDNFVSSDEIATHTADCLNKFYDDIEKKYSLNGEKIETTACLVCSKDILKADLDAHLDTCMGSAFDGKMEDEDVEEEEDVEESEDTEGEDLDDTKNSHNSSKNSSKIFVKEYNCPMCLKLIPEEDMNKHIDECLTQGNFESIEFD